MRSNPKIDRRKFIGRAAAGAAAISIIPSHVLGGPGRIAPSDKIHVANIGCGTQGLREMGQMLKNPHLQVTAVCDPNKYSTNYLDWSKHGIRNSIRNILNDPNWGAGVEGIAGGRDVAQDYINRYYAMNQPSGTYSGCKAYEDFRELLAREDDIDVVKIMTPDHLHATLAIAAMDRGKHVITHKPIANRMDEGRKTIRKARESGRITHLLAWSDKPEHLLIKQWIDDGVIGNLKEIHNWSFRPVWPQWTSRPKEKVPVPEGFNWDLWLGPVPHIDYHPNYTHNVFRGWYDFGGGSMADMGHYSLFPLFQNLGIHKPPVSAKAYGTTHRVVEDQVCVWEENDVAFPHSCMVKLKFPEQESLPAFDLIWYDGGMKPFAPEELEADGREIPNEGMMFVGDQGKILAGFLGEEPQIIPASRHRAYAGPKSYTESAEQDRTMTWATAIREGKQTPGSFLRAETVTETINLGAVALRAGERVDYDSGSMRITNVEDANRYLRREYREGWEI